MEIKTNEEDDESVEDLISLSELSEETILKTLEKRFSDGYIYSYIGSILLAFNPYKMLNIYGKDNVKKYEGQTIGELPPHLFAISNACYSKMCRDKHDQVVLISGESGSGKTECTKLIMQYLAATNRNGNNDIPDQILEGNPLLESFGNAKTIRNDNSSRFGKYIELYFQRGVLKGARTSQYLLEKSRIVKQSKDERNYHIFYEMLSMKKQERSKYGLQTASQYFYLNQGESCTIPGRADADNFELLTRSLNVLGFTEDERDIIIRILASVLHLGNIYFTLDSDSDVIKLGSDAEIKWISHLLKLSADWLKTDLTTRVMEAREEKLFTPLSMEQAQDARDAIAKALYGCLFAWLVERLNQIVYRPAREKATTMGILDIFGFEEVELNSFEQLCINYANEMLQCFFNECVFQQEQLEYKKDRIEWQHIEFPNNERVIQLISCKPHGILHILDDECNFPQATDKSFLDKCHYRYESSSLYEKPRMPAMEFSVYHYAGKVTYNVKTFLEKNKDTLRSDVIELLSQSKDSTISRMFEEMKSKLFVKTLSKTTGRYLTKKPRAQTVAAQFNESLMSLIDNMKRCNPYFVRCVKPNTQKSPMSFDKEIVLDQLRYNGVLQLIEIRKKGYPVRIKFPIFIGRYQCLLNEMVNQYQMPNEVCTKILATVCPASELQYQVGASKVFLRENFERRLDMAAKKIQEKASLLIQKNVRTFLKQKQLQKTLKSVAIIQSCIRARKIRSKFGKVRHGIVQAQALYRSYKQQKNYKQGLVKRREEQEKRNQELVRKQAKEKMEREQHEKAQNEAAMIANLDVPGELAWVQSKEHDWQHPHMDCQITAVTGHVTPFDSNPILPADIDSYAFSKYAGVFFKNHHSLGMINVPIKQPFLQLSNIEKQHSLSIFKLILRFMCETKRTDRKRKIISDYIIQKGLQSEPLRDEIYCQIANQTWFNQNPTQLENGWQLMANCLCCIPPSETLNKFLFKYVSDVGFKEYKEICQRKSFECMKIPPYLSRTYPPCLLEWKAALRKANMALSAKFPDEKKVMCHVESWTNAEDFAAHQLNQRNMYDKHSGWTVVLEEESTYYELMGYDYVLDLISEIEILPSFPVSKMHSLVSIDHSAEVQGRQIDIGSPHHHDRDRKVVLNGRLPEPLPASAPVNAQQNRRRENIVFSSTNPLNQRHIEDFLPSLTGDSALNSRYYTRKAKVQVNGVALDESMSDGNDVSLAMESRLNSRHFDDTFDMADSKLNSRYVQRQNGHQEMPGVRLGSTSEHSNANIPISNWVDNLFEKAVGDEHTDTLNDPSYLENNIRGGGGVLTQVPVPKIPIVTNQQMLPTLGITSQIPGTALNGLAPDQYAAALVQQQQQQQALTQAYLNQMAQQQQQTFVQAALQQQQQQQQQQVLMQAALQQQQLPQVNQPYIVLVQPNNAVPNAQLATLAGQQLNGAQLIQNQMQLNQLNQQQAPPPPTPTFKGNLVAPSVYSKPPPPVVPAKPSMNKTSASPFVNGTSNVNTVPVNGFSKPQESALNHKTSIPAGILLNGQTDSISINTSQPLQNGHSTDSPSLSTETSPLSSPSDQDSSRQTKVPLPTPPLPPLSNTRAGTVRVRVGKVVWPPIPEQAEKAPVRVGKLEINENLAEDMVKGFKGPRPPKENGNKTKPLGILPSQKSKKLSDQNGYADTMKKLEKKFSLVPSPEPEVQQQQQPKETTVKTRRIEKPPAPAPPPPRPATPEPVVSTSTQVVEEPAPKPKQLIDYSKFEGMKTKLCQTKHELFLTYQDVPWTLRLRKEVFSPKEKLEYTAILDLVFYQVVRDVYNPACIRITKEQRLKMRDLFDIHDIHMGNYLLKNQPENIKRIIVDTAKEFPTYFCRLFPVAGGLKYPTAIYLGVNHSGIYLVTREKGVHDDQLKVLENFKFDDLISVIIRATNIIQVTMQIKGIVLYTKWANQIKTMVDQYCDEQEYASKYAYAKKDHHSQEPTLLNFRQGDIIKLMDAGDGLSKGWLYGSFAGNIGFFLEEYVRHMDRYEVMSTFKQPPIITSSHIDSRSETSRLSAEGVFVMLDYALQNFHESVERRRNALTVDTKWTEREQVKMIKWTKYPINRALVSLESQKHNDFAAETFTALMVIMGDLPMLQSVNEVKSAIRILKLCHEIPELRDEFYCQLCKQTTCNPNPTSLIHGWRFFSLFAAYNDCSESLRPHLTKYLENSAMESSNLSHIADLCLKNLRKTFRFGGRKNVPLETEITSIIDGRMSKDHTFCYGGHIKADGMVQIKSSTIVRDIIADICSNLDINDPIELEEYSLFLLTHPEQPNSHIHRLSRDEYLLDIMADLERSKKPYEIMLQRMVWILPINLMGNKTYIDLIFMQCVTDYLGGYLLLLKKGSLPKDSPYTEKIPVLAALLHQTTEINTKVQLKDLKKIVPQPILELKEVKPQQWLNKINQHIKMPTITPVNAKSEFIRQLSSFELFGSMFFHIKSIPQTTGAYWLAVNKNGVQIISKVNHELLVKYEFNEILSTRLYREKNKYYLDMKLGNLLAQRISRFETDQVNQISTLIGQYIQVINHHKKRQNNATRTPLYN